MEESLNSLTHSTQPFNHASRAWILFLLLRLSLEHTHGGAGTGGQGSAPRPGGRPGEQRGREGDETRSRALPRAPGPAQPRPPRSRRRGCPGNPPGHRPARQQGPRHVIPPNPPASLRPPRCGTHVTGGAGPGGHAGREGTGPGAVPAAGHAGREGTGRGTAAGAIDGWLWRKAPPGGRAVAVRVSLSGQGRTGLREFLCPSRGKWPCPSSQEPPWRHTRST